MIVLGSTSIVVSKEKKLSVLQVNIFCCLKGKKTEIDLVPELSEGCVANQSLII